MTVIFAPAQNSQFLFDPNGNLSVQMGESIFPPQIIGQPQNQVIATNESAAFSIVVANPHSLTYQWRFNDANLGSETNAVLLLQNVSTNNEGKYRVVLTNPSGSVTSAPAMLWIDNDTDGMGDSWELTYFSFLFQLPTGDFDGDGSSNFQEFLDDTNPADFNSIRHHLTVVRDGGSVVINPDQPNYTNGQTVTLTATTSANESFHAWLGDIVTRQNPVTLVMTNNQTVFARFTPITISWTNLASGDWDAATNWTPNLPPRSNDIAVIIGNATATLNTPADCIGVILGSDGSTPTLTGTGTLTVRESFLWVSGTMSGNGRTTIETGATLEVATPSGAFLNGRTLENSGTALVSGTGIFGVIHGAVITNRAGSLFHLQNPSAMALGGFAPNGRFDNAGTFRKSGSSATATGVRFNNYGTFEIQSGTFGLGGDGTHSGSFDVPASTALILSGGIHVTDGDSTITGGGQLTVSGATATLAGLVNLSGSNTFSSGTANLIGNYICTNNTLNISGGTVNFNGTGTVAPAVLLLSNGTLAGSNTVIVTTAMNWTSGTMSDSGRTIIAAGATLDAAIPSSAILATRTLENGGTILWQGAGLIGVTGGAVITNRAGALFHAQNSSTIGGGLANGRIINAGTFRKSGSTGTTTFSVGMNLTNYGTVDIHSGIVAANGNFAFTSNSLLSCAIGGTSAGTGYGQLQKSGSIALNGALSVELINGFVPAVNDSFTVLTAGTRSGTFGNFAYPSNLLSLQLSNTPNSVVLHVTNVFASVPAPMLLMPELVGSNLNVKWVAVSNATYRLEFNPDLASFTNWNPVPGDVTTTSNTASKLDPLTTSNRFYRVRVVP